MRTSSSHLSSRTRGAPHQPGEEDEEEEEDGAQIFLSILNPRSSRLGIWGSFHEPLTCHFLLGVCVSPKEYRNIGGSRILVYWFDSGYMITRQSWWPFVLSEVDSPLRCSPRNLDTLLASRCWQLGV